MNHSSLPLPNPQRPPLLRLLLPLGSMGHRIGASAVSIALLGPCMIASLAVGALDQSLRAAPLPFDPVPSAFEAWLNARRGWPEGAELRFSGLNRCFERSANGSPYSVPLYQCLAGTVSIRDASGNRTCQLSQVLFLPGTNQVRYRTLSCR